VDTSVLRSARAAKGLTLQAVVELTKLSPRMIAAIEGGRLDQLPSGFYARAHLRAYADAVRLDANLIRPILDAIPIVEVDLETVARCRATPVPRRSRTRTAVAVDAAVVAALSAAGVLVCAALTGAGEWDLPAVGIAFVALAVPTLILYFALLGATGVGTAGACLFRVDFVPGVKGPVDGALLMRRTCAYFRSEAVALLGKPVRLGRSLHAAASLPSDNAF
jgi:transcriptional regulator with XRE-family HTH domain